MKTYLKTALRTVLIVSGAIFIQSCSDDDEVEVKQLYYLSSEPAATLKPSQFELSLLDNTLVGERTGYYVVGKSTMRAAKDVKLHVVQDNLLAESYNAKHKTKHETVPEGAFSFSTRELTIKAGDNFSSDTLRISASDLSKLEASKTYVLPIALKSSDGGAVSANRNTICFVFSKEETRISTKKPASWIELERGDWTVTASDDYGEYYSPAKAVDGDGASCWFLGMDSPGWWAAEWTEPATVVGISIQRQNAYHHRYNLVSFSVDYKKKGDVEWRSLEGNVMLNETHLYAPQYTMFGSVLEDIVAFKLNVLEPGVGDYTGIGELNLFKKK